MTSTKRNLEEGIRESRPGLVIVDTVGMTTQRNLGRPEDAKAYFGPLMEIASASRVSFLLVTHLSRESQALGRRIVGAARVVWKLTRPDPEGQPDRRRLWVDKSYGLIPKPLGMTIAADGCTFDDQPPESEGEKKGRPPKRQDDCKQWLLERLADGPVPVKDVRKEVAERDFTHALLYRVAKVVGITQVKHNGRECFALPAADDDEEGVTQTSWL